MDVHEGNAKDYILEFSKSIYGLKQSILNLFTLLSTALYDYVILGYMDDILIDGQSKDSISNIINSLAFGKESFEFTKQGSVTQCLVVEVIRSNNLKN
eukprot:14004195-Ditylum_brightwellii.AAC.1